MDGGSEFRSGGMSASEAGLVARRGSSEASAVRTRNASCPLRVLRRAGKSRSERKKRKEKKKRVEVEARRFPF